MHTITKVTPTSQFHPATGKVFIIELSNGDSFEASSEELIGLYCYLGTEDWKTGYDEEKVSRMVANNFQDLVGESWNSYL